MPDENEKAMRDDAKGASENKSPGEKKGGSLPPAGPHADPRLMNPDATPGSGAIAPIGETDDANIQPTS